VRDAGDCGEDRAGRIDMIRTLRIFVIALLFAAPASAQVGKSQGVVDANTISEADLTKQPGVTPAIAKALIAARPFDNITALNTFLLGQKLTQDQANALYRNIFVNINLNTATAAEIMLIPGAGKRMAHEFEEYRPWRSYAQFEKEIGKYVDAKEVARLAQYTFIPLNLNTATEADFMTIPGAGKRMAHEFEEYRPWKTQAQFEKEIGKYVDAKEVRRFWRYMVIQ
jgi:DNA uptake protein ComE-like DNA-binding protein